MFFNGVEVNQPFVYCVISCMIWNWFHDERCPVIFYGYIVFLINCIHFNVRNNLCIFHTIHDEYLFLVCTSALKIFIGGILWKDFFLSGITDCTIQTIDSKVLLCTESPMNISLLFLNTSNSFRASNLKHLTDFKHCSSLDSHETTHAFSFLPGQVAWVRFPSPVLVISIRPSVSLTCCLFD